MVRRRYNLRVIPYCMSHSLKLPHLFGLNFSPGALHQTSKCSGTIPQRNLLYRERQAYVMPRLHSHFLEPHPGLAVFSPKFTATIATVLAITIFVLEGFSNSFSKLLFSSKFINSRYCCDDLPSSKMSRRLPTIHFSRFPIGVVYCGGFLRCWVRSYFVV